MHSAEQSQIVRYVNTFTAADWESRRPNDRTKKGITRVSKSIGQNAEKYVQGKQKPIPYETLQNQNEDHSNREHKYLDPTSTQYLLERIRHLQLQLTILEKQKIELQKRAGTQHEEKTPFQNLVESQYVTCKEDLDQIMEERSRMEQALRNLEGENSLLRLNNGIQEQYIIKVQIQLDLLRSKENHSRQVQDTEIQTQNQANFTSNRSQRKRQTSDKEAECNLGGDFEELQYLKEMASAFENQTQQFSTIIERLQQQNSHLIAENNKLTRSLGESYQLVKQIELENHEKKLENETLEDKVRDLQEKTALQASLHEQSLAVQAKLYESKLQSCQEQNEKIIESKIKEIEELSKSKSTNINRQEQYRVKRSLQQLEKIHKRSTNELQELKQAHLKLRQQIIKKEEDLKSLQSTLLNQRIRTVSLQERILSFQLQKERREEQENRNEANLKSEYDRYRQQFDQLLTYLEQKSEVLREKEMKIGHQLENDQLLCWKNEETLKKQTQMEAIIIHYENCIKKIQGSIEGYVNQLMIQKRLEKDEYLESILAQQRIDSESNKEEKVYLLKKISILEEQVSKGNVENQQIQKLYKEVNTKISEKQSLVSKLRAQIIDLSKKYEQEVASKSMLSHQHCQLIARFNNEQAKQEDIRDEVQQIKSQYNLRISTMQASILQLERSLEDVEDQSKLTKEAFEQRIVQVKKDYDILYAKYLKYKNLSIVLQEGKHRKN